jgi:hypothetical protein
MKLDKQMAKLICDLEYYVGNECYNPNSYDGWTGNEGCEFRYPVYVRADNNDTELTKVYGYIPSSVSKITSDTVSTMKYKFGSNHLFIGLGIQKMLEELEALYDLDFNELEKNRKSRKSKK